MPVKSERFYRSARSFDGIAPFTKSRAGNWRNRPPLPKAKAKRPKPDPDIMGAVEQVLGKDYTTAFGFDSADESDKAEYEAALARACKAGEMASELHDMIRKWKKPEGE